MRNGSSDPPAASRSEALLGVAAAGSLFALAWLVRLRFHAGFILGDDAEEFALIRSLVENGPSFEGHLRYRFPMWVFNYFAERVLGPTEAAFFLPTWLASSALPVLAYGTLRAARYARTPAFFAGLFVALSPFEVLIGSVRANDLFVELFLACALWVFVRFEHAPRVRGAGVALALWLAFYAKLWSLFLYPVVGLHYLLRVVRAREWQGLVAFAGTSLVLHAAAAAFWRATTGVWFPFLTHLSATYPVPVDQLGTLLLVYPRLLFVGSEYGTTLFGAAPVLLVACLVLKLVGSRVPALVARAPRIAFDRYDGWLLVSCLVFFALLNFFPNHFTFDQYYSVPRIFRYLAPLSFGVSLLAAKLLVDLGGAVRRPTVRWALAFGVLLVLGSGTLDAVAPGRSHRARVAALREALRERCPPVVVVETWQARFFRDVHLRDACPDTFVQDAPEIYQARALERWLAVVEARLPRDTVLATGLIPFVYYACYTCGMRLTEFERPLDPRWVPIEAFEPFEFDAAREPVRLWRWTGEPSSEAAGGDGVRVPALPPQTLFERGIERFDAQDYAGTRAWMEALLDRFPDDELADDAAYFFAVTSWREMDPHRTVDAFQAFLRRFPSSRLVRAAHYHIGLSHRALGRLGDAKAAFEATIRTSDSGDAELQYARGALESMRVAPLVGVGRALTEFVYRFQSAADRTAPGGSGA